MDVPSDCLDRMKSLFAKLYPKTSPKRLETFLSDMTDVRARIEKLSILENKEGWYKESVVYCLYVDCFSKDFHGLKSKLSYIRDLGANTLWLLPIFASPMKDGGYDVSDYMQIRRDLLGLDDNQQKVFQEFVDRAHKMGMRIIIDMPFNHTSKEHSWFRKSMEKEPEFEDFYHWSHSSEKYKDAPIIFEGICQSNWHQEGTDMFYFHRFFPDQPDLNYENPSVLMNICRVIATWCENGIDGFRLDAIPFLWKEDFSPCENHPNTHHIIKFFRCVVDYVRPGTMMLAESCQHPNDLVEYFGQGTECHAAYHFPLMPKIFLAMARESSIPIFKILDPSQTPVLPNLSQWFVMLRCHDEFTFELLPLDERKELLEKYCKNEGWNFRNGKGIASRLSELFDHDPERLMVINSVLLSLLGTPILFYGDEFMKKNDHTFYKEMTEHSGIFDSRYLCRGNIDWDHVNYLLSTDSSERKCYGDLKKKLKVRSQHIDVFSSSNLELIPVSNDKILFYKRWSEQTNIFCIHNLSKEPVQLDISAFSGKLANLFEEKVKQDGSNLFLSGFEHFWFSLEPLTTQ